MDLFVAKAYSHWRNEWARYIAGHTSEDLATDAVKAVPKPSFNLESIRLVVPLMAETKPFVEEI